MLPKLRERSSRSRLLGLIGWRNLGITRIWLSPWRLSTTGQLCALICGGLVWFVGWQMLWDAKAYGTQTVESLHSVEMIAASTDLSSVADSASPLSPITLGLESPADMGGIGREFLIVGHSDRLLDREAGERIRSFWPLRELMAAFNRDFVSPETPLVFSLAQCSTSGSSILQTQQQIGSPLQAPDSGQMMADSGRRQYLTLCYEQLQAMDDYADDLSGSLTEQHLAVLDMVYFLLDRELSRLLVALHRGQGSEPLVNIQPLEIQTLSSWLDPEIWASLPDIAALDQLTAVLPQRLRLQQQTGVISGTQWLFNQGNPLLEREQLKRWTKDAFSSEVYQRLICAARGVSPGKFPFLKQELPAEFASEGCS